MARYVPETWVNGTAPAINAPRLNALGLAVDRGGPFVRVEDHGAVGSGTGNYLTQINAAVTEALTLNLPLVFGPGIFQYSGGTPDFRKPGLRIWGLGEDVTTLRQASTDIPAVNFGDPEAQLCDLTIAYSAQPTTGHTASVGINLHNLFMSKIQNVQIDPCYESVRVAQVEWPGGNGQNTAYSSVVDNLRCLGWRKHALNLSSYIGASTPMHFRNVYCHNNFGGSPETSSDCALLVQNYDGVKFDVLNIEQCVFSTTHAIVNNGGGLTIDNLHFESVTMQAASTALFQGYDRALTTLRAMSVQSTAFTNATGQAILNSGGGSGTGTATVKPRTRLDGWRWLGGNPAPSGQLYLHRSADSTVCRVVVDPNDDRAPFTALRNNGGASSFVVVDGVSAT